MLPKKKLKRLIFSWLISQLDQPLARHCQVTNKLRQIQVEQIYANTVLKPENLTLFTGIKV